ncbi:MAG: hypothetical protein IKJ43_03270 [Bacilli bacterium]|nr:hypothetical protein [Bacilli bacterium]
MGKYVKVMFGNTSSANKDLIYKFDSLNVCDNFNVNDKSGFYFSTYDKILRWLIRGDTLCDVTVPSDGIIVECENPSSPHGVFKSDKIILSNPRKIDEDMALDIYEKSDLPLVSYYKSLAGLAIRGYRKACYKLIEDRISKDNIDLVLNEINDFYRPTYLSHNDNDNVDLYNEIIDVLNKIKG